MATEEKIDAIWKCVLDRIREEVKEAQYDTWFTKTRCADLSDEKIVIEVANKFYSEWLRRQYATIIEDAVAHVIGRPCPEIEFQMSEQREDAAAEMLAGAAAGGDGPVATPSLGAPPSVHRGSDAEARGPVPSGNLELNPLYTFENFVVGPSNRLAHAAALAVIESAGRVYNPLFVHGGLGLGKTHLLQGICHAIRRQHPHVRLQYMPCEQFVNQFIAALSKNRVEHFREAYRRLDVLVIDDIHFLASKDHSQEEFFHTFNALYNSQKQIILSSDSAPKDIPTLEERLVSRFKWGLVCEIEAPTFETRLAIIRNKARHYGVDIPDDVSDFLAAAIKSNVRELEGAVTRLLGFARIMNRDVDMETAREALGDLVGSARRRVTIDQIVAIVTELYGVRLADLQSKKRYQSIAVPRQVCMYLARKHTHLSLAEIGGYFGGRDHSTVLYACEKIAKSMKRDLELRAAVTQLNRQIET